MLPNLYLFQDAIHIKFNGYETMMEYTKGNWEFGKERLEDGSKLYWFGSLHFAISRV